MSSGSEPPLGMATARSGRMLPRRPRSTGGLREDSAGSLPLHGWTGAIVCADGCGNARRFACPYHGWVYDPQGALVGI